MNLLLFGAPGAGKGTQSSLLVDKLDMVHISTGDLFRNAIKNQTTLGREAKKYMDKGELVPDAIVIGMVEEELKRLEGRSFILDGFPRTVPQAQALENLLVRHNTKADKVIFLEVPNGVLVERLAGRRVCKNCGAVYHVSSRPTQADGVCDVCGGSVVQRDDDKEEAIKKRLQVYSDTTKPLKEFYREQNKLVELDGTGTADEVFGRIQAALKV